MATFLLPSLNWASAPKFTSCVVCISSLVTSFSICTVLHGKPLWYLHNGKFIYSFLFMHSRNMIVTRFETYAHQTF